MSIPLHLRVAASMTLVVLSSACLGIGGRRNGSGVSGFDRKPVASKEAPTSLVAVDETRCLVSEKKFHDTEIGTSAWCFWSSDGEGSRAVSGGAPAGRSEGPVPAKPKCEGPPREGRTPIPCSRASGSP